MELITDFINSLEFIITVKFNGEELGSITIPDIEIKATPFSAGGVISI